LRGAFPGYPLAFVTSTDAIPTITMGETVFMISFFVARRRHACRLLPPTRRDHVAPSRVALLQFEARGNKLDGAQLSCL